MTRAGSHCLECRWAQQDEKAGLESLHALLAATSEHVKATGHKVSIDITEVEPAGASPS